MIGNDPNHRALRTPNPISRVRQMKAVRGMRDACHRDAAVASQVDQSRVTASAHMHITGIDAGKLDAVVTRLEVADGRVSAGHEREDIAAGAADDRRSAGGADIDAVVAGAGVDGRRGFAGNRDCIVAVSRADADAVVILAGIAHSVVAVARIDGQQIGRVVIATPGDGDGIIAVGRDDISPLQAARIDCVTLVAEFELGIDEVSHGDIGDLVRLDGDILDRAPFAVIGHAHVFLSIVRDRDSRRRPDAVDRHLARRIGFGRGTGTEAVTQVRSIHGVAENDVAAI